MSRSDATPHPLIRSIAVPGDCYVGNMTRPCGHVARSICIDCDTPCQPAMYRYGHAGNLSNRSSDVLLVALFAILSILLSCNTGRGVETAAESSEAIVMIPTEELTIAECEEVFGAGATRDVRHVNPSTATVSQVEEAIGKFMVPEPVSPSMPDL